MIMGRKIELGASTSYGFMLPKIRYNLSKNFVEKYSIGGKMLDFGCGNGANTYLFENDFVTIDGIDVESDSIVEANGYISRNKIANITYTLYEGIKIPFNNDAFDFVTSFEVIEHTYDDLKSLLEINRVLKKNGIFILSVPNKWYLMETHGFNFPFGNIIPWNRIPFLSRLPKSIHSRYAKARIYTKREIIGLLIKSGFEIKYTTYIMPPFDRVKNIYIKNSLKRVFGLLEKIGLNFIGGAIFLVCRKNKILQ